MFDPAQAEAAAQRYGYSRAVCGLLEKSRGNQENLLDFLADEGFPPAEKEALLLTLTEKDWRDVDADVLREALAVRHDCSHQAFPFTARRWMLPRPQVRPAVPSLPVTASAAGKKAE